MTYIMVDIEADGPCPGLYSMVQLGAVVVDDKLDKTFFAKLHPLDGAFYQEDALKACNLTRGETLLYDAASYGIINFYRWLNSIKQPDSKLYFVSDNNGFDWQFVNYYCWKFLNENPFGHSSTNLGSLYKGMACSMFKNFKHLRKTIHDHNPVNDAKGNAEALLEMKRMGLNIKL